MKRNIRILISSVCLAVFTTVPCFAREWRGIVPLHATRADVIKLLGNPTHALWDNRDYFVLENETIRFEWIDPTCVRKYPVEPDSEVRPNDLVLSISITPKKPIPRSKLDLPSIESFDFLIVDCIGKGECNHVIDNDNGIAFTDSKDGITDLSYFPRAAEFKAWLQAHKTCRSSRLY